MIKITFLGTSASIPTFERNHPAIALEYFDKDYFLLLFDCGENTQLQLMRAGISFMKINIILITHWHADHFAGLIPLLQTMNLEGRKEKLIIIAPEIQEKIELIKKLYYYDIKFKIETIDAINENKLYENKYFEIYSIKVKHTVPSVAYAFKEKDRWKINEEKLKKLNLKKGKWLDKLKKYGKININNKEIKIEDIADIKKGKKIVYSGDCEYDENLAEFAKDCDILIHEATFLEKDKKEYSHSSALDAAKIAKLANAKRLILTHISRRYHENYNELLEEAKSVFENVEIAKDLFQIILK